MNFNIDKPTPIYKTININIKTELCNTCVENKHTKIIKSKKMTPMTWKL